MAKTIWKFEVGGQDRQTITVTQGVKMLSVQMQDRRPHLWVLLDPTEERKDVVIECYGTGHKINQLPRGTQRVYIGTVQDDRGLVWHFFYLRETVYGTTEDRENHFVMKKQELIDALPPGYKLVLFGRIKTGDRLYWKDHKEWGGLVPSEEWRGERWPAEVSLYYGVARRPPKRQVKILQEHALQLLVDLENTDTWTKDFSALDDDKNYSNI